MRKRQKLVLAAVGLAVGMGVAFGTPFELRYSLLAGLTAATWLLTVWALREGLGGVEWLCVPLPATIFSLAVGLFSVLLPQTWPMRIGVALVYLVGMYALLLSANIFSVAAIRTIALFRAASAVSFAISILSGFLLFDSILSFKLPYWANGGLIFLAAAAILLPALWSVRLEERISAEVAKFTGCLAAVIGMLAVGISFWPVQPALGGMFLSTALYVFLGLAQHYLQDRLQKNTVWEYGVVGVTVLVAMMVTASYVSA